MKGVKIQKQTYCSEIFYAVSTLPIMAYIGTRQIDINTI